MSHYKPDVLQAAAAAAQGTFIPAEATDKAARIKSALARLRTQSRATLGGEDRTPRYQWFLLPAILLLWLDTILAGRKRTSPSRGGRGGDGGRRVAPASVPDRRAAARRRRWTPPRPTRRRTISAPRRSSRRSRATRSRRVRCTTTARRSSPSTRCRRRRRSSIARRRRRMPRCAIAPASTAGYTHLVRGLAAPQADSGAAPSSIRRSRATRRC